MERVGGLRRFLTHAALAAWMVMALLGPMRDPGLLFPHDGKPIIPDLSGLATANRPVFDDARW